jgi:hypothetical protein
VFQKQRILADFHLAFLDVHILRDIVQLLELEIILDTTLLIIN